MRVIFNNKEFFIFKGTFYHKARRYHYYGNQGLVKKHFQKNRDYYLTTGEKPRV